MGKKAPILSSKDDLLQVDLGKKDVEKVAARRNPSRIVRLTDDGDGSALGKGIAGETGPTRADWYVVDHAAVGVGAARSRTRIDASLIKTRRIRGAVRIENTLGPTVWRNTNHVGQARAFGHLDNHLTLRVEPARRW